MKLNSVAVTDLSLAAWKTLLGLQGEAIGQCLHIGIIRTANYPLKKGIETNKSLFQLKFIIGK